ncbi:hypothetical protein ACFODT_12890 [Vibrio zhugei]|uniref:Uncharacterized protein n=1 Tax=Vibrio zhugei TaxID=2479546 RepID=A0ABV7CDK6_9VIBR|nr:hypothetical protein [Vibrio zhugei]
MAEANYQMAIDLLCCHLGISEKEARTELGLQEPVTQGPCDDQHFAINWSELLQDD